MSSLYKQLKTDFSQFHFEAATGFWWSGKDATIHFDPLAENNAVFTLHELSHALLGHKGYEYDIDLIKLERDAWEYAKNTLGPSYEVIIDDDTIQGNLDTYRDWLHARSTCPDCESTGIQTKQQAYRCLACGHLWRVNEARICALRRYSLKSK